MEDQDDLRLLTRLVLVCRGHAVVEANNGLAGLSVIERERPDVAFVDLGLPGLTGYEIARRVRAQASLDRVLLVALTGYCTATDIAAAKAAGFDLHIAKPASPEVLEDALLSARASFSSAAE